MNKISEKEERIKIGITHGDFNGINYEIILKSLNDNRLLDMFTPVIYGLSKVLAFYRKNFNFKDLNYNIITRDVSQAYNRKINIFNLSNEPVKIEFGKATKEAGKYAVMALKKALEDINKANIDVLVTAPLNKSTIVSDEFPFPGHTDFLAHEYNSKNVVMLMVNDQLRIGTITGHIPLKEVTKHITEEKIVSKVTILEHSLKRDFGINKPKIAILGLNPHSGDNGIIGNEDKNIIYQAISKLKKLDILAYGPFPADGFFGSGAYLKYDAIMAMYHDQGLIPFKLLAKDRGVNYTSGLPIIRTSPAHGTAYDIAGKNIASAQSMRDAIYLAIDIFNNRRKYDEEHANPLPTSDDKETE
jgi:4-hydroxythreonine-4-phosphate dehydrogenase